MHNLLFFLLLLLPGLALAQAESPLRWGGLGYAFGGGQVSTYPSLTHDLRNSDLPSRDFPARSFQFGGGGFALLGSQWLVSGYGFGSVLPAYAQGSTRIRQTQGGGGLGVGYALLNRGGRLCFPTLGLVGTGTRLIIDHNGSTPLSFGEATLSPGSSRTFELGQAHLDMALHYHRLLTLGHDDGPGGFSFGLSAGALLGLRPGEWTDLDLTRPIGGLSSQRNHLLYLRLHFGGGGFRSGGR